MAAARTEWEAAYLAVERGISGSGLAETSDLDAVEALRLRFLGRKGELTQLLKSLKDLTIEDRRDLGPKAQELREKFESDLSKRVSDLQAAQDEAAAQKTDLDPTLPGFKPWRGSLHPLTQTMREMTRILTTMGFSWAEGPQVESERYNFNALNIPQHHPARDMLDTFYLDGIAKDEKLGDGVLNLLRTHTSPVQIRAMENTKPPIRIFAAGRVFRHEATDATHSAVFHQIEGLAVDKNVSFADLKATLAVFLKSLFGEKTRLKLKPSYFPFTEPSAEVSISCFLCSGTGCSLCKGTGYIEILGAGVVHPNVLKGVGWDPEVWSGFAFGIGVERVAMLRSQIKDIRSFYENDLRFLSQFDETLI
jgi:phenylalanyl-tRNA synthetase alpha chain